VGSITIIVLIAFLIWRKKQAEAKVVYIAPTPYQQQEWVAEARAKAAEVAQA